MDFLFLLILLFACFGITFTLVHAEILDILKIRPFLYKSQFLKKLLKCSFCTSFYVSIFLTIVFVPFGKLWLLLPFAFPPIVFLWERIVILLDEKIIDLENKRQR